MVLITGGSGLLGKSLAKILNGVYLSSADYDLRNQHEVKQCFDKYQPKVVVHLAGRVGGIIENTNRQYDFYYDNITINTNVLHCCVTNKVEYVISMAGTCMYPEKPPALPLTEDMIHEGSVHMSNCGYSYAKRMMQVQMECAKMQYGTKSGLFLLGNLYGPHDHFNLDSGHVVASLLRRVHDAKVRGDPSVMCYGTGSPLRQFTYVDDVAKAISLAIDHKLCGEYNICNQNNQSIRELVETIVRVVGYKGKIQFNNKLDGVQRKEASDERLQSYVNLSYTSLQDGLTLTYQWYKNNATTIGQQ